MIVIVLNVRQGSIATETPCPRYVRSSLNLRHDLAAPRTTQRAMCGRLQVGKENLHVAGLVKARSVDAYVIHAASVAVSREHRRAKTDRLDSELLKRAFLGWLRGERDHCKMVAIPTAKDEDAKRPNRERESLVGEQIGSFNRMKAALIRLGIRGFNLRLEQTPSGGPHAMVSF